ncbi:MAG TPA: YihY/virulence factor BrkB family protein [Candidatus Acidoferrales bacterium]|nr:YihY/virulence factor BrkB family protein [Candidatus Acidoferrales bacterium]
MGVNQPLSVRQQLRAIGRAILQAILKSLRGGSLLQAQAVAFNMFLAFFPAVVFLAGVLAYAEPGLEELLEGLRMVLPPGSRRAVVDSLLQLSAKPGRLLLVGAIGTVLLGSQLMFSLTRIFAAISPAHNPRSFWDRQLRSLAMVFVAVIPWVAVSLLVLFGKFVRAWLIEEVGIWFDSSLQMLWTVGYFALAVLTATLVLAALYHHLGPDRRQRWDEVLPGAALAMMLWWVVTSAFGYYVRRLAIYDFLYGGFAAAIGLLIWMYLSAVVVLIGEQFNAEMASLRSG